MRGWFGSRLHSQTSPFGGWLSSLLGDSLCYGGMFARRAPGALLLDYVPPEEPPSTPLGNALRIR